MHMGTQTHTACIQAVIKKIALIAHRGAEREVGMLRCYKAGIIITWTADE